MKTRLGFAAAAVLAGAALVLSACATAPAAPNEGASPGDGSSATAPDVTNALEVAWLDDGRMFAVVTWGSSTCVPVASEVTASGQEVTVTLEDASGDIACTADMRPRATIVGLPEGVKAVEDVQLTVVHGDLTSTTELDGDSALTGAGGQTTDYLPSAGWFDDGGIVLLTWGSSSCQPVIDNVEETPGNVTVTFVTADRPCTMDMSPRATVLGVSDAVKDDATLTLVGDNLDAVVTLIGD